MINFESKDENGHVISTDQIGRHIRKSFEGQLKNILDEQAIEQARKHKLYSIQCPAHDISARNWRFEQDTPGGSRHHLVCDECCEALVQAINNVALKIGK